MSTAVVVFTRDLRIRDNPSLTAAAADHESVVPLFVEDDVITGSGFAAPGRARFLAESLADLDDSLRRLGGRLILRRGDWVREVCRIAEQAGATQVHAATDVSAYAQTRQRRLREALGSSRRELCLHEEVHTVLAPGRVTPAGSDHFAVFTPYHRRWTEMALRPVSAAPDRIQVPDLDSGALPNPYNDPGACFIGGETDGRRRAGTWLARNVADYGDLHDTLADDATSRLSPYLHFGCVSPRELLARSGRSQGAAAFVRQLAWRDFHHQVLAARPGMSHEDYRSHGDRWRDDPEALQAWQEGRTGIPIVDAGMRQLRGEGWMHNRARLITGSFLTKTLYLDWRAGAEHYFEWLLDGDIANNCGNWQWVAGTGTDTRPNRVLNPLRQADRYDPAGDYVRRYVPELAHLDTATIHRPWRLPDRERHALDYPAPIVDLDAGRKRFLAARGKA